MNLKNKKVAILGLGVDTEDVVPWLEKQGAKITILDESRGNKFENLQNYDLIIRSPGVYRYRKELEGLEVSSKTKLFFDLCPARIVGVTGTKGKGTTSTLIYEILKVAGKDVYLGGNIGKGVFEYLPKLTKDSWVVLELSSFQLIDLHKSPHIAVVLMVTSEHLNWHKSIKEYVDAKKNIVAYQNSSDFAIVNKDYPNSVKIGKAATGQLTWISKNALKNMTNDEIGLRGEHNRENVVAAATVAKLLNINEVIIRKVIKNFKGLEHRLEEVKIVNGIKFYNDSFSTIPETAIAAIKAFKEPIILIIGGSSKNSDFSELSRTINNTKNIKLIIEIGVEGPKITKNIKNKKILRGAENMAKIVQMAYNKATK
ncbi:MAG: UDP-N-acetylmuramoyl-L-alanine--D-glutamate ligase, partial [bacterium]|nr:UDP-N-acetylmuramoyl-L-alanine--D-glutamate ligase [bacterium]